MHRPGQRPEPAAWQLNRLPEPTALHWYRRISGWQCKWRSERPPPSTPPELVNNRQKVLSKEQAEIVAKNKAAAFLMREVKRASEKQKREAEVFEAMQWHA